jgi:hypothetical protein
MPFIVQAHPSDQWLRREFAEQNITEMKVAQSRPEACALTEEYWRNGYWVEVYDQVSKELLAGPIDPDWKLPSYIV